MISTSLKSCVEKIDLLTVAMPTDYDALWGLADQFWSEAFPSGIGAEERHAVWQEIITEFKFLEKSNGQRILDVLEWPATGAEPVW